MITKVARGIHDLLLFTCDLCGENKDYEVEIKPRITEIKCKSCGAIEKLERY